MESCIIELRRLNASLIVIHQFNGFVGPFGDAKNLKTIFHSN